MFPKQLDGAEVLYYTDKYDFGVVANTDGIDPEYVCYLSICKYKNEDGYYLFLCDENYEVITDDLLYTIKECFEFARYRKENIIWHSYI
jgi:hypothetical protein